MAAAETLGRVGYGCEISPAYCDVIIRRMMNLGVPSVLPVTSETFAQVAESRGLPADQALNPKAQDPRAIKHNGPAPYYGTKKKTS
jgi:hypothetical protein